MREIKATCFAPAERAPDVEIAAQAQAILGLDLVLAAMEAVNELVVVLNAQRQIVFANNNVLQALGAISAASVLGLRPGEAVGCQEACLAPGGCGTGQACATCGALRSILSAQAGNIETRECHILRANGDAMDLLVRACPITVEGHALTVCSFLDISQQNRRRALDRIFFHDVLNLASGAVMLSRRVAERAEKPGDREHLSSLVAQMLEEILQQRDLAAAEASELAVDVRAFSSRLFLEDTVSIHAESPAGRDRNLSIVACDDLVLQSDRRLMGRVAGNLIKNALEASPPEGVVGVSLLADGVGVVLSVHNATAIPEEILLQIFRRSFSTKGSGRGLGTYSAKLLTERYLGGRIWVRSNDREGTTFRAWYPVELTPAA